MFSIPEWDAYKSMTPGAAIAHIVHLAETRHLLPNTREYAHVVVNFVEDCSVAKDRVSLDWLLLAITEAKANPEVMVTVLRCTYSIRTTLKRWYSARDKIHELLVEAKSERMPRILAGLMEPDPHVLEDMDGLDAWQSLLKQAEKYR